jgi:hypothetical protein
MHLLIAELTLLSQLVSPLYFSSRPETLREAIFFLETFGRN